MNQSTFQLLGNVASADFYLCEGSDINLISDNNAYNMKGRLQQLIEFFGQVTKEDLEWRFPPQTFPGTPI